MAITGNVKHHHCVSIGSVRRSSISGVYHHWPSAHGSVTNQNWCAHVYITHGRVVTWCLHTSKSRLFLEPQGSRGHQRPEGTFYFTSAEPLWILNNFTHPRSLRWDRDDFPFWVFPRLNYGWKYPLLWLFCSENDPETDVNSFFIGPRMRNPTFHPFYQVPDNDKSNLDKTINMKSSFWQLLKVRKGRLQPWIW